MEAILNIVLPVFAIMGCGYAVGRVGLLGEQASGALNAFVFYVALPALFFGTMAQLEISQILHWPFIAAFGGGLIGTFGLAMLVAAFAFPGRLAVLTLHGAAAIFSNTGYMGIPLLLIAYGEAGLPAGIIATVMTGVVVMAVATLLIELDGNGDEAALDLARNALGAVVKSPLLLSAVAGILWAWSGLELPTPVARFCDLMGSTAGPCALFAMGLFMVGKSLTAGLGEVGWLSLLKLLVMPAVTYWLAFHVMTMDTIWAQSAVIQAALPTGALVFVLAHRYGVYIQRATAAIVISTLLSVGTISGIFIYFGVG
ncbi:AEC family transporter [Algihabitans sp.]|uniref:AEC family transporter n=1 Tax=Algihabitans sp. TaxID=2821514 RepID=UPI003BA87527